MHLDRRSFIKSTAAACGSFLLPSAGWAAATSAKTTRVLDSALPLDPAEEAVLAFATRYANSVRFVGAGVLARVRGIAPRTAHLLIEVPEVAKLESSLTEGATFGEMYAQENALSFVSGGIEFTVENLLPAVFAARLAGLTVKKNLVFAHDALSYDPATRQLSDPFTAARVATLKLVNGTLAGPAGLDAVLRGTLDGSQVGLREDAALAAWQRRLLRMLTRGKEARATAQTFLQQVATLAERLPTERMKALLGSRAVSTALQQVFGIDTAAVIAQFDRLRPTLSGETSNAALWLALLLAPEIESNASDGAATTWLRSGTRFAVLRSSAALAQARALVADPDFPQG
jgi:hypothetical protein